MSSLVTGVLNVTVGFLVNKGRDAVAQRLKEGDLIDQKLRDLIVREINDVKSKLDGLARKDLLAAMDFFKEGLVLFDEVIQSKIVSLSSSSAERRVSLAKAIRNLELTDLDESSRAALANAKKRFEDARRKATEAFNDEALKPFDRVVAMGYRVMATVLATVDNPSTAIPSCRMCVERLHSLPVVQNSFTLELHKGFRRRFSKEERREIISAVCRLNCALYDVTVMAYGFGNKEVTEILQLWPCIEIGKGTERVNPLLDSRVAKFLRKHGTKQSCLHWTFGQEEEKEHRLKEPWGITANTQGHFIVADQKDADVKVFDGNGIFLYLFRPVTDEPKGALFVHDVATDENDNIYVLITMTNPGADNEESYVYMKTPNRTISLKEGFQSWSWTWSSLAVSDNDNVLVRGAMVGGQHVVDMYANDGQLLRRFGEGALEVSSAVATANDGDVIVATGGQDSYCVNIFTKKGKRLRRFKVERSFHYPQTTFHQASEHVVVAGIHVELEKENRLEILIYTKEGEFVRSIEHKEENIIYLRGIAVTMEGKIAVIYRDKNGFKVLVV